MSNLLEKIYENLPWWCQNAIVSVMGIRIQRQRFGKDFHEFLKRYEARSYDQAICLRAFLREISKSPFYRKRFADHGVNPDGNDVYAEIAKLPILTKAEVKAHISEIENPRCGDKILYAHTSGTTGSGLTFPCALETSRRQWAVWWRYRREHGIKFGTWHGWFGGKTVVPISREKPPFWRINFGGKQVMFSQYHLSGNTVKDYATEIERKRLTWLHGYPSQISLLSTLMLEKGITPNNKVKFITFGAENLLDSQKNSIKKAFPKAHLAQHYGLSEGVANLSEDVDGKWRIDEDFAYVEFVPLDEKNLAQCRIVGTNFWNKAFPLVRYDTGDIATVERDKRGMVIRILSIDGRKEDFVDLPNGVRVGRLDHIFKELDAIAEAQIVQHANGDLEFHIVRSDKYTESSEKSLWREIRSRIPESVKVSIIYEDRIPRTKNGKLRLVVKSDT